MRMPTGRNEPNPPCTRVSSLTQSSGVSVRAGLLPPQMKRSIERTATPRVIVFSLSPFVLAQSSMSGSPRHKRSHAPQQRPSSLRVGVLPIEPGANAVQVGNALDDGGRTVPRDQHGARYLAPPVRIDLVTQS